MADFLKYPKTDTTPQAGDVVKFLSDQDTMVVDEVIATEEDRKKWGLAESGIMMVGPRYGRIFDTLGVNCEVELVERAGMAQ